MAKRTITAAQLAAYEKHIGASSETEGRQQELLAFLIKNHGVTTTDAAATAMGISKKNVASLKSYLKDKKYVLPDAKGGKLVLVAGPPAEDGSREIYCDDRTWKEFQASIKA